MTKVNNPRIRKKRQSAKRYEHLTCRVSVNDLTRLQALSEITGDSKSQIIYWGIRNALKNYPAKCRRALEASKPMTEGELQSILGALGRQLPAFEMDKLRHALGIPTAYPITFCDIPGAPKPKDEYSSYELPDSLKALMCLPAKPEDK